MSTEPKGETMIKKLLAWLRPTPAPHTHDLVEFPTDMGRKIYRKCRGCDFSETVPAPAADRAAWLPLADRVLRFQESIVAEVEQELKKP